MCIGTQKGQGAHYKERFSSQYRSVGFGGGMMGGGSKCRCAIRHATLLF